MTASPFAHCSIWTLAALRAANLLGVSPQDEQFVWGYMDRVPPVYRAVRTALKSHPRLRVLVGAGLREGTAAPDLLRAAINLPVEEAVDTILAKVLGGPRLIVAAPAAMDAPIPLARSCV